MTHMQQMRSSDRSYLDRLPRLSPICARATRRVLDSVRRPAGVRAWKPLRRSIADATAAAAFAVPVTIRT
jgi:hypothetical protein